MRFSPFGPPHSGERKYTFLSSIKHSLAPPSGTLLVHLPDDPDDIDESLEDPVYDPIEENPEDAAIRVAVEDTFLGEQVYEANNAEGLAGIEQQCFENILSLMV